MLYRRNPQLNKHGELIHLLSTEGLPKATLTQILDTAANFVSVSDREVKKVPLLRGKSVFNLMPSDALRHQTRWGFSSQHNGTWDTGLASVGNLGVGLNLNRVSDDAAAFCQQPKPDPTRQTLARFRYGHLHKIQRHARQGYRRAARHDLAGLINGAKAQKRSGPGPRLPVPTDLAQPRPKPDPAGGKLALKEDDGPEALISQRSGEGDGEITAH